MPSGPDMLRELRHRRGISQEDLARTVGVTLGAVSQWETGRSTPRRNRALQVDELLAAGGRLAAAFGYADPPTARDHLGRSVDLPDELTQLPDEVSQLRAALHRATEGLRELSETVKALETQTDQRLRHLEQAAGRRDAR